MNDDQVQIENQTTSSDTDDDEKEVHDALAVELSSSDNYFTSDSEGSTLFFFYIFYKPYLI